MSAGTLFELETVGAAVPTVRHVDRYGFRTWARWLGRCPACRARLRVEWHEGDEHDERAIFATMRARCECGTWCTLEAVTGERDDRIKCGARCVNAIGPACSCSCGGENHGGR